MKPNPIVSGTVINDRYEIRQSLGKGGMGEVFLAFDRSTQEPVALKIVREEARMPGDDEALRQELLHARSVSHPNVCRVHDLAPSPWGPILVMEHIAGQTLHSHIRRRKAHGGYTPDEFRKTASEASAGLAAIHAQGLVHGDLKPGNVMVTEDRAVILDFGFAQERARLSARRPGAPPDGGTPNYMSPERLRSGGASPEDDVYALGLTLWEMWTCRVPEPGSKPRSRAMRSQIMFDVPASLSIDEVKQVYRCLADDAQLRPQAKHLRFFNATQMTASPIQVPRDRLDPGPPLGRGAVTAFQPNTQGLLVTYATNAPEAVGLYLPLNKPSISVGRRSDRDLVVPEATVSGSHTLLRWQAGSWVVEDQSSTNGTYVDHSYERKATAALMHGGEVQLGEMRVKLVSFGPDTAHHRRARDYLVKRDGLTGLLSPEIVKRHVDEEGSFAEWAEAVFTVARYELRGPNRLVSDRPTILEMLALRRAAQRVVELTEMLLLSITPVVAGRTGPLRFAVSMVGPSVEEAQHVVEQIVSQVQGTLPESLTLSASLVKGEPGRPGRTMLEGLGRASLQPVRTFVARVESIGAWRLPAPRSSFMKGPLFLMPFPQPSIPPSEPAAFRYLGRGRTDRSTRVQLTVALVAGLVMVAVPLYLWRRPPPEAETVAQGLLPAPPPTAKPLSPLIAPLGLTMGALSAPPASPAPPAGAPRGVAVTDAKVLRCTKPGTSRVPYERCDRQPFFEEALAKAVRDNAPCAPATAAGGSVNFVLDVDYRNKKARVWAGRSGTMRQKAKDVIGCVSRALPVPDWAQVPHQYEKYQIALLATYPPAPQNAGSGSQ